MLIKLMKHEFRATGRVMGPLYLVLLVTAIGANLSTRGLMEADNEFLNMLGGLLVVAFVFAIMGVCLMSLVLMVQRFYKNLLGDEGYVMFTLPASVHQQMWSKLIVSAVWFAATFLAVCAAVAIVAYEVGFAARVLHGLRQMFEALTAYYALNGTALVLCGVLCHVPAVLCRHGGGTQLSQSQGTFERGVFLCVPIRHADTGNDSDCIFGRIAHPPLAAAAHGLAAQWYGGYAFADDCLDSRRCTLWRGFLFCNNILLEEAPEPGVNWTYEFHAERGRCPRSANLLSGGIPWVFLKPCLKNF